MADSLNLTHDAEYLLDSMYSVYLARRKNGVSADVAGRFGDCEDLQALCVPEWPVDDINAAALSLCRKGLLSAGFGDNAVSACRITDDGIAYMEQRFARNVDKLLRRLAELRGILWP